MSAAPQAEVADAGVAAAFAAVRARVGLFALVLVLAVGAWLLAADQMHGMDNGPWTSLGGFGWFVGVWVAMMAAMMFPSLAPTAALYARMTKERAPLSPLLFTAGYLVAWTLAGVAAFALAAAGRGAAGDVLAWDRAGRWVAGVTLLVAAAYEFTPLKNVCLTKCRSPLGFVLGSWRSGPLGALRMGAQLGGWCVGCCWALMAALFALGVMSVIWMAVVAALIALEKLIPWRRLATAGTAALLLAMGVLVLASPATLPGLTIPGDGSMPAQVMQPDAPMR